MEARSEQRLAEDAVALAQRWIAEAAEVQADPAAERLAGVLKDPNGLPFTIGFVDGVMRPESLSAAASHLHRVAPLVPESRRIAFLLSQRESALSRVIPPGGPK